MILRLGDVACQSKSGLNQQNPWLILVNKGSNFALHGITVQNSPNFHVVGNDLEVRGRHGAHPHFISPLTTLAPICNATGSPALG